MRLCSDSITCNGFLASLLCASDVRLMSLLCSAWSGVFSALSGKIKRFPLSPCPEGKATNFGMFALPSQELSRMAATARLAWAARASIPDALPLDLFDFRHKCVNIHAQHGAMR